MSDVLTTLNDPTPNQKPGKIVVIKKKIKVPAGAHGGAWKIAYADFVTAMMAFFLLLWILNSVSEDQKKGLVEYFQPANVVSAEVDGVGLALSGTSPTSDDRNYTSDTSKINPTNLPTTQKAEPHGNQKKQEQTSHSGQAPNAYDMNAVNKLEEQLEEIKQSITMTTHESTPVIELRKDITGVRIDIIPQKGRSLFQNKSITPQPATDQILAHIGSILAKLPNQIVIITNSVPTSNKDTGYDKWTFAGLRSLYIRNWLQHGGLDPNRLNTSITYADHNPIYQATPLRIENERISILIKY